MSRRGPPLAHLALVHMALECDNLDASILSQIARRVRPVHLVGAERRRNRPNEQRQSQALLDRGAGLGMVWVPRSPRKSRFEGLIVLWSLVQVQHGLPVARRADGARRCTRCRSTAGLGHIPLIRSRWNCGRARAAGTSGSCRCWSWVWPRSGFPWAPCSRPAKTCNVRPVPLP